MTATIELLANADTDRVGTDSSLDSFCESLVRVAASLLDAPIAYVSVVEHGSEVVVGAVDRQGRRPSNVADIDGLVSRARQEIRSGDGVVVGTLCVADRCAREWTEQDFERLSELADLLTPQLDQWTHAATTSLPGIALSDDIALLADSVSPLVDLAELHDDPKLQRYAAAARRRLVSVLESVDTLPDPRPEPVRVFDLRHAVNRALREAVFVSGRENVMMDLGPYPLPVSGEQFVVERAVTHLVGAVLNHTGHGYARLALETDADTVALTVVSDDCTIPTGEMSRIAASFDGTAEGPRGAASIRLAGGETEVFSPGMNARSGPSGSAFAASWVLARG